MDALLDGLAGIPGTSSAVFDGNGVCRAARASSEHDVAALSRLFELIAQIATVSAPVCQADGSDRMAIDGDAGVVLIARANGYVLVVVSRSSASASMLNVLVNGVVTNLINRAPPNGANRARPVPADQRGPRPAAVAAPIPMPISDSEWDTHELRGVNPPSWVGPEVLAHVLRTSLRYLGAQAKSIIIDELRKLGASPATLKADQFADFINRATSRVDNPIHRDDFMKELLGDK